MASCSPSYEFIKLPINPVDCGAACDGVKYALEDMKASTAGGGGCKFEWKVTRKKPDGDGGTITTTFADEALLACPDVKEILFYCDSSKECPIYKLILKCVKNDEDE